jgi:methionyl-tRNA formyltransferase
LKAAALQRPLRIIFAGTPEFARIALERLHLAGHTIALVLTQPDRPAGRGMKMQASAVKKQALEYGVPVEQPRSLRLDGKFAQDAQQARQAVEQAKAEVMVVAAYGLILPQWVLDAMQEGKLGCLNIHGSMLPRWRGAAPIHRAIEAGDSLTGVTIMQMDAGLDTGDMLLVQSIAITPQDSTASLHDKVAELGADLIVQALQRAAAGTLQPQKQPVEGVTYAHKIEKAEGLLNWHRDADSLCRQVRAFDPFPGASSTFYSTATADMPGETIKVWRAIALDTATGAHGTDKVPGTVIAAGSDGIDVATGDGVLRLLELQRAGGKRLPVADFLQGFQVLAGQRFAAAQSN